jgi:hypothetical protein
MGLRMIALQDDVGNVSDDAVSGIIPRGRRTLGGRKDQCHRHGVETNLHGHRLPNLCV